MEKLQHMEDLDSWSDESIQRKPFKKKSSHLRVKFAMQSSLMHSDILSNGYNSILKVTTNIWQNRDLMQVKVVNQTSEALKSRQSHESNKFPSIILTYLYIEISAKLSQKKM